MLGPEVLGVHSDRVQKYLASLDDSLLVGVAHHLYERGPDEVWDWRDPGPDSYADEMRGVAAATRKPLFQTEFNTDEDQGIEGGFETAWIVHHSLVAEGVVAFLYWDLIWVDGKGLVSMHGRVPRARDHYYSMRHFARFTDPGYTRIGAQPSHDALLASAYVAPDQKQVTTVLLNTGREALDVTVHPGSFPVARASAFRTTYRPGRSKRWEQLPSPAAAPIRLPGRSVATIVLR
jgi:glucuronoarabinoxylan endo-1,4-beta-xylanase